MAGWALLVIWKDGDEEYLCDGLGDRPTRFVSSARAADQRDFMLMGMDDEVQSINVVPYPREKSASARAERGHPAPPTPEEPHP